mgnify:FL=1
MLKSLKDNTRYPCHDCGSSDGMMYDPTDNHTYCFACGTYRNEAPDEIESEKVFTRNLEVVKRVEYDDTTRTPADIIEINNYPSLGMTSRNISGNTTSYFGVKTHKYEGKPAHFYPYGDNCYKVRILPKDFRVIGKPKKLFGQDKFNNGKILVITEGEVDALSVSQAMMDKKNTYYPVVSIPSANQLSLLLENRSWVRRFNEVILWFDNDEAGRKAVKEAAKIIGFDKVKTIETEAKDASELFTSQGATAVINAIWGAQKYNPAGILTGEKIWEKFMERQETESVPYPECLGTLNEKISGMRHGEITLFTSGTGSGKSTVIKEVIWHLLSTTKEKIGLISLEESIGDTAEKLIGMSISKRIGGELPVTHHEMRKGFEKVFKDERLVLLDHQGSVEDSSLIDKIEYMALMGCKYLFLDHITIAVSEGNDGLTGNAAVDKVMSDLLKIVKKHNVWLGIVSHLRKATDGKAFEEGRMASIDDIKGSGSIKQISFDIIAFNRNLVAEDASERNRIGFAVLKSRFTGLTGPAGFSEYDTQTGRLQKGDSGFGII